MDKRTSIGTKRHGSKGEAEILTHRCYLYLQPILEALNRKLDRRLVNTFLELVLVLVINRHRNQGMLLSELGGQLISPEQAPAGTKRIANLIHSQRWQAKDVEEYLWEQADEGLDHLLHPQEDVYVVWDESILEKPESLTPEGLCAVRSAKAGRLKRIKPGFYNPPGGRPIFVPGFNWLQILLVRSGDPPVLAHLHCWTTRGEHTSSKREEEHSLLRRLALKWGFTVVHVWDQGFAGHPWVSRALLYKVRFILRWKKGYTLINAKGEQKKAWEITRGKRSLDHRQIWDARRRCYRKTGIVYQPVWLPDLPNSPLCLVVSRPGKGKKPWYLLTNEPIASVEDAWRIVFGYSHRWQVEMSIRYDKSELAFESPRIVKWEDRLKFLQIAALVHGFLLSLLSPVLQTTIAWLLDTWCHRNGKWSLKVKTPLYRLRLALSQLWSAYRPHCLPILNSG
jgi:hypothetical protein